MVVGMMRVKNEQRWIRTALYSLLPVCERIFILDDHSIDLTREIALQFPQVTLYPSPFDTIDEARDKTYLLQQISGQCAPDWVLGLDGDEALHPEWGQYLRGVLECADKEKVDSFAVRVLYLWDREDQIRVDGTFKEFFRPSLFRFDSSRMTFQNMSRNGNLHCSSVPEYYLREDWKCSLRVIHFGYLHKEERIRKYNWYTKLDPDNEQEGFYRHIIIGDLLPLDAKEMHGGPLQLEKL